MGKLGTVGTVGRARSARARRSGRRRGVLALSAAVLALAGLVVAGGTGSSTAASHASARMPSTAYRANDYADGRAMSILPPGENGLVTAQGAAGFELRQQRPADSDDQLGKYENLLYGYPSLTDATLGDYFDDESFGVAPGDVTRVEHPESGVTIYRDQHDVPHVYGNTDATMAFGAGYAQAEDRLFLMDILRHYGEGTLAQFLGGSCEFEQMDHDQLLLAPYTETQAVAQVDALPTEYGSQGRIAKQMIYSYVAGVNAYVAQTQSDPADDLPADYAAAVPGLVPQTWGVQDVVAIAGLVGGIFGRGGGSEVANAHLLQYLQHRLGAAKGARAFAQFKDSNDPLAPTTVVDKTFRYEQPGTVNRSLTALPDYGAAVTGGPADTAPDCDLSAPAAPVQSILDALKAFPQHMSNALVVNAAHSADGHPIAVFGPQVSYYAPQILSELDLHSPDYDAEGASFPGTGLVELGRGEDYAWSATSAGSDVIDQRIEKVCAPGGGTPQPDGTYYEFDGRCLAMATENFREDVSPKPGGAGGPAVIDHVVHLTRHGVVQGWTTVAGKPVAIVDQRSTFRHDVDSVVGFLGWGEPAVTHDVRSWMRSAARIEYTFNWFYVDDRDTGYYVSGLDPVRPAGVNPDLPTWGTGRAEWRGFLSAARHVHEIDPAQGFFVSWNNKPAPGFDAADDQYGYGQVYRSVELVAQLRHQLAAHKGRLTRANVVQAMETAASQDLDGVRVLPLLLTYLSGRAEPAGVRAMLAQLRTWIAAGAHRRKAAPTDTQYRHAAAVAIADELVPNLIRALYDPILAAGGLGSVDSNGGAQTAGYAVLPMQWVNTPDSGGAHLGSAYDGGYESYLVATLQQLLGRHPADGFGTEITGKECDGGPSTCPRAIDAALLETYDALVTANRGSTDVASWTASTASAAAGQAMPVYDGIEFQTLGLIGQPEIDWQNRPTFQQVVEFPRHRPR